MSIDFDSGLFGLLRKNAGAIWDCYINHEFVRQLGASTLPITCFQRFLRQDYLFLLHFSRSYALLAAKSTRLDDIRDALAGLQAIADEMPLHVRYCAQWGIDEKKLLAEEEAPATIAYTRYVMDIGLSGDRLDLLAALMPCVAGYAEIGLKLASSSDTVWSDNPYADWIRTYEGEDYQRGVVAGIDMLNRLGDEIGYEKRFTHLSRIFNMATKLEAGFWQMGLEA